MLDRLEVFLADGGSLLYLGGNGVFEQCSYSDGMDSLAFFYGHLDKQRSYAFLRNLTPPRPEREILGVGIPLQQHWRATFDIRCLPLRILAERRSSDDLDTGLETDDLIGIDGLQGVNGGGASGWEMDCSSHPIGPDDGVVAARLI